MSFQIDRRLPRRRNSVFSIDCGLQRVDFVITAVVADDLALLEHADVCGRFPVFPIRDVRFIGLFGLLDEGFGFVQLAACRVAASVVRFDIR